MYVSDKAQKALGRDTVEEMEAMNEPELKAIIVEATSAMRTVKEELERNPKYLDLKADLSAITQGKRDVDKRQKAKIQYSLQRLEEIGKLDPIDRLNFEREQMKKREELAKKKSKELQDKIQQRLDDADAETESEAVA